MIVVADTSIILNLCRIRHEHLLRSLFGRVLIPTQVATEFTRLTSAQARFVDLSLPPWIEVVAAPLSFPSEVTEANLDLGESAAISLCISQQADALLIDESLGRAIAAQLHLRTIGILGILLEARRQGLIQSVTMTIDQLERTAGFWIAPSLRARVIGLAGEAEQE